MPFGGVAMPKRLPAFADRFVCIARLAPRAYLEEELTRFAFNCTRCGHVFFRRQTENWIRCPFCALRAPWSLVKLLEATGYDVATLRGYTPGGGGEERPPTKNPQA